MFEADDEHDDENHDDEPHRDAAGPAARRPARAAARRSSVTFRVSAMRPMMRIDARQQAGAVVAAA